MPHADVNGQRLYYEDTGSGEPVLAFSHGLFMDQAMFDPQVEAFGDRYRCVAWDERGHGETQTTPDPFSYWDSASDLLGLLDHLGVPQAVLVGMSQGGYLSLRAALTAPERVRGLVLIDTQDQPEDPEKVKGYDQLIGAWTGEGGPPQQILDIVADIILGPGFPGRETWQARWREMPSESVRQVYQTLTTRKDDVRPRLGELTMPALVIHGEHDAAIEVDIARRVSQELPNAELVVVPEAGHAANLSHPEQVNSHIERFVASL